MVLKKKLITHGNPVMCFTCAQLGPVVWVNLGWDPRGWDWPVLTPVPAPSLLPNAGAGEHGQHCSMFTESQA